MGALVTLLAQARPSDTILGMPWRTLSGLVAAVTLALAGGCAARGPSPATAPAAPTVAPSAAASTVVTTALSLMGTPYRNGGADPSGFDCSGFVSYVFAQAGWHVPRTVTGLFLATAPVADARIAPGDLVFFRTSGTSATHVGIALGDGYFVHAPSTNGAVRVEPLSSRYWTERYVGARRVAATGTR
jgi:cell wall-associated NlpC family hydrolase